MSRIGTQATEIVVALAAVGFVGIQVIGEYQGWIMENDAGVILGNVPLIFAVFILLVVLQSLRT